MQVNTVLCFNLYIERRLIKKCVLQGHKLILDATGARAGEVGKEANVAGSKVCV